MVVHAVHLGDETRVGFVVSRAVGNAVMRNRVKRRLRHLAAPHIDQLPAGTGVVVRALPRAASDMGELPADFEGAWRDAEVRLTGGAR
jgi:ribonuclease P protein component